MNYYLAYGIGDFAPPWNPGTNVAIGPADIDALISYLRMRQDLPDVKTDGRIRRVVSGSGYVGNTAVQG
jgi:hypothetical protein